MNSTMAVRPSPKTGARNGGLVLGPAALAVAGYGVFSDVRIAGAVAVIIVLASWGWLAYQRPRTAMASSILLLLLAGTKFRVREATASLDGVLDMQILFEVGLFAVIGVGVLCVWARCRMSARVRPAETLIAAYVGFALLSVLWSAAPALTLVRALQLAVIAAFAAVAVRTLRPSPALWTVCAAVAAYTTACALLAAAFPWAAGTVEQAGRVRFAWFSVHPIEVGTLAAIAALGVMATALWDAPLVRRRAGFALLRYPAAAVALVTLGMTNSRGPLFAFAGGVATLIFLRLPQRLRLAVLPLAVAALLTTMAIGPDLEAWLSSTATDDSFISRVLFQSQSPDDVLRLSGRRDLWKDVQPAIAQHAFLGYGYQASRPFLLNVADWAGYAHNAFLQTVLDLGIAGVLALAAVAAVALTAIVRPGLNPWVRGSVGALAVFLLLNSISSESFAAAPGFEVFLLFLCALSVGAGHAVQGSGAR